MMVSTLPTSNPTTPRLSRPRYETDRSSKAVSEEDFALWVEEAKVEFANNNADIIESERNIF